MREENLFNVCHSNIGVTQYRFYNENNISIKASKFSEQWLKFDYDEAKQVCNYLGWRMVKV